MRKTERVTIAEQNRDHGKTFIVTEMGAWQALQWAAKAMLALSQGGTSVPPGALAKAASQGPETLAILGLQIFSLVPESVALPLMNEIKLCVTYAPPSGIAAQPVYEGALCQVEEPSTWFILLKEAFALHLSFLPAAPSQTTE